MIPYTSLYGSNGSFQPGLKPQGAMAAPKKLARLIEAGERAHETLQALPKDVQEAYEKQFKMLCEKVDKLKEKA